MIYMASYKGKNMMTTWQAKYDLKSTYNDGHRIARKIYGVSCLIIETAMKMCCCFFF